MGIMNDVGKNILVSVLTIFGTIIVVLGIITLIALIIGHWAKTNVTGENILSWFIGG